MAAIPVVWAAMEVAKDLEARFVSRHDSELVLKLMAIDCGGLSKMTEAAEACFRRYVRDAICRLKGAVSYLPLRYRFQECFGNRPAQLCADWFQPADACVNADAGFFWSRLDDFKLLNKLGGNDCGGLSRMSKKIEGCFRKYVGEAIDHMHKYDQYLQFVERFIECFANLPELPCDDGLFRIDVFGS